MIVTNSKFLAILRRQKGIAVLECVIVLPLTLFMILAVAEIANGILQYNALTHAVRDAARYIAEEAGAGAGVIQLTGTKINATKNLAAYGSASSDPGYTGTALLPGLSTANVTVALFDTYNVRVAVEYPYQPLFGPSLPALAGISGAGGAFTMRTEVIMRVL